MQYHPVLKLTSSIFMKCSSFYGHFYSASCTLLCFLFMPDNKYQIYTEYTQNNPGKTDVFEGILAGNWNIPLDLLCRGSVTKALFVFCIKDNKEGLSQECCRIQTNEAGSIRYPSYYLLPEKAFAEIRLTVNSI